MKIAGDETLVTEAIQSLFVYIFEKEKLAGPSIHTCLLMCFVETHDSERTEKENSGSLKSLDEVGHKRISV